MRFLKKAFSGVLQKSVLLSESAGIVALWSLAVLAFERFFFVICRPLGNIRLRGKHAALGCCLSGASPSSGPFLRSWAGAATPSARSAPPANPTGEERKHSLSHPFNHYTNAERLITAPNDASPYTCLISNLEKFMHFIILFFLEDQFPTLHKNQNNNNK